ncbi:MAG: hypothetical protein EBZ48_03455 [Proteobacteria bacterium]|nr:hypothetical protein [Pseudomonadota bacterium]
MENSRKVKTAQSFFQSLIDYAGLFPPAALSLDEAIKNYRAYLDHPMRWVLSRFILTPAHLEKLSLALVALFSPERRLDLSLVCKNPSTDVPAAMQRIRGFSGTVSLGSVEVALAPDSDLKAQVEGCDRTLREFDSGGSAISAFFELTFTSNWESSLPAAMTALKDCRQSSERLLGFKLRCGGTEPHLVPTPHRVALGIQAAAHHQIPIKFTAGLHHPFPKEMSPELAACDAQSMHGYFNVFFAAFGAFLCGISAVELTKLLTTSGATPPRFGEESLEWCGITISLAELTRLRASEVISFGSCNFIEPIEDAVSLQWL